jgi:putative DNA primase/helicase
MKEMNVASNNDMEEGSMQYDNDCDNEHPDHRIKRKEEPPCPPPDAPEEPVDPDFDDVDEDILNQRNAEEFRQLEQMEDVRAWIKRESDLADLEDFISSLDSVKNTGDNSWTAKCPAHDDTDQGLTVSISTDIGLVFKCSAGCAVEKIQEAFWPSVPPNGVENQPNTEGASDLLPSDAGEGSPSPASDGVDGPPAESASVALTTGPETGASIPLTDVVVTASMDVVVLSKSEVVAEQDSIFADLVKNRHTDQSNSERLVEMSEGRLRFWFKGNKWFTFNGKRWVLADWVILQVAKKVARAFLKDAAAEVDKKHAEDLLRHARYSESSYGVNAMIALAKGEPALQVSMDDFEQNRFLINLGNGTYDLKNKIFREHRLEDMLTRITLFDYDPEAKAHVFEEFIAKIFRNNMEIIAFVQKILGYCLSGDCSEQKLFILWGKGRNGKSTLVNAILDVLGDYGQQAPPDLLLASRFDPHPTNIAGLKDARLVVASETSEGRWLNDATVKTLTGQDKISARLMRQDFFTFTPEFKIFLTTNHQPNIRMGDFGIERRLVMIPFDYTVPADEVDPRLQDKLKAEKPGIFNWLVKGFKMWEQDGLIIPKVIFLSTVKYIQENDFLLTFLQDECDTSFPENRVRVRALYDKYTDWAKYTNEPLLKLRRFSTLLIERGFTQVNSEGRHWQGIALKADVRSDLIRRGRI